MLKNLVTAPAILLVSLSLATLCSFADGTLIIRFEGNQVTLGIGTVVAVDAQSLGVNYRSAGETVNYAITKSTEICLNGNPRSSWKQIRVGQGIIVVSDDKSKNAIIIRDGELMLGADVPQLRCKPRTAFVPNLFDAVQSGRIDAVRRLMSSKADVNVRNHAGWTPLHVAARNGHNDMIDLLLNRGALVDAQDKSGFTPLMHAIILGKGDSVDFLLRRGSALKTKNSRAIYFAAYQQKPRITSLLIAKGADVNHRENDGSTPILKAADKGHAAVVRVLLAANADVNARTHSGITALMMASQNGHLGVVQELINAKADVNAKTQNGISSLMVANGRGHSKIAQRLRQAGAKE